MGEKSNAVIYGEIVAKCWDDADFKKKFLADPESVLEEAGFKLEEGVTYKVIEAPKLVNYVVIPHEGAKEVVQKFSARLLNRLEQGVEIIPEGVEVRIVQNTDDVRNLILPASPKTLTAAELKAISGGDVTATTHDFVQTTEAVTTVTEVSEAVTTTIAGAEVAVAAVIVLI